VRLSPYRAGVRTPVNVDDIVRLDASAQTPEARREAAATLLAWADDRNPDDGVSEADLVAAAAWSLDQAGDVDAALELHRRAVTAEGTTTPDARCTLAAALFDAGRPDEARQVAEDLRRSGARVVDIAGMARVFELVGDLQQAHRWTAMGISRLELIADDEELEDVEVELLLTTRRRVRQALGLPAEDLGEPDSR
jgi:tetratricopeptide (TPR) repeat protein